MATLLQLRNEAKKAADMRVSSFWSDAEWTTALNYAADELYETLVKLHEDSYYAEATFTTGDGSSTLPAAFPVTLTYLYEDEHALPADFFKLLGVDLEVAGKWVSLKPFSIRERAGLLNAEAPQDEATRYRLQGNTLKLLPRPTPGLSARVLYVPRRPALVADADELDGVMGWERLVIVMAAAEAKLAEESDASALLQERDRLKARVMAAASQRNPGHPARVVDVTGDAE